jgi:5-methylcytosine-specific restriction enzyme A
MDAYLLTWNPARYDWDELPRLARRLENGQTAGTTWSCGQTRRIEKGDRLFMLRQGSEPRGIVGSGRAAGRVVREEHWDEERAARGDKANYIEVEFDALIDPACDQPLPRVSLIGDGLSLVHWATQMSGIGIPPRALAELEALWASHLGVESAPQDAFDEEMSALEGEIRIQMSRHRARERALRKAKIVQALAQSRGHLRCEVPGCGFDFRETYGEIGRGFAEVHHLKPLANLEAPYRTRLTDLAIVCSNCHAVIHRGGESRPLDEVRISR